MIINPKMRNQFRLFILFTVISMSFAGLLKNRDFESPPTNITANSTSPFLQLTGANTIPGWSHNGTVRYVSSSPNISLPGNGHALQLGQDGRINQTIRDLDDQHNYGFVLSFILVPSSKECFNKLTAVNVSVPGISKVFFLNGHYGKQMWETHGLYLGLGSIDKPFNLVIEKASTETGDSVICDPIVDELFVKAFSSPKWYSDAIVANNGFEEGPGVSSNFSEGILLHEEPDSLGSPLQSWSIRGTIKYIDSKHYKVPEEKAAVELLSGDPSGISLKVGLIKNSKHRLVFTVGDGRYSCLTNFTVFAQAGTTIRNFTMNSNGTGSVQRYSMAFNTESEETEISISSFQQSQTMDGVSCGPVIDNVRIHSFAAKLNLQLSITFLSCIVFELVIKNRG